jgi:hypothetical protein
MDLSGVTFVDDAGQACLAAIHQQGVEFIASDALTKDIVAEITQARLPDHARLEAKDPSNERAPTVKGTNR